MATPSTKPDPHDEHGISQDINWQDYRDHLAAADKEGRCRWLYPKKPVGKWYRWRTWFSWVLITIMFAGPWIRINGNPLLMINIIERRSSARSSSSPSASNFSAPFLRVSRLSPSCSSCAAYRSAFRILVRISRQERIATESVGMRLFIRG